MIKWIKKLFLPEYHDIEITTPEAICEYNAKMAGADFLNEPMLSLRKPENFDKLVEHPKIQCAQCPRKAIWFRNMSYPRCRYHLNEDDYG